MKRLALVAAVLTAAASPVRSGEPGKITVRDAVALSTALHNLDGRLVVIKQNGVDATVMIPWTFDSGRLRLRIASDLSIADAVVKTANDAQSAIFKEVTKKYGVLELKAGTPERADYDAQIEQLMSAPAAGTQDLARIKASELKLDVNEIAISVLSALHPILDDDVK
jgi:hypothetical protein